MRSKSSEGPPSGLPIRRSRRRRSDGSRLRRRIWRRAWSSAESGANRRKVPRQACPYEGAEGDVRMASRLRRRIWRRTWSFAESGANRRKVPRQACPYEGAEGDIRMASRLRRRIWRRAWSFAESRTLQRAVCPGLRGTQALPAAPRRFSGQPCDPQIGRTPALPLNIFLKGGILSDRN